MYDTIDSLVYSEIIIEQCAKWHGYGIRYVALLCDLWHMNVFWQPWLQWLPFTMATSDIAQCLTATLSPDPNARISAELKLAEYFTDTGAFNCVFSTFCLTMAQMPDYPSPISFFLMRSICLLDRWVKFYYMHAPLVLIYILDYSASIALRKYVKERWSPYFPSFKGSAPPVEVFYSFLLHSDNSIHILIWFKVKTQIREGVFQGLSDPDRKIRSLCVSKPYLNLKSRISDCAGTHTLLDSELWLAWRISRSPKISYRSCVVWVTCFSTWLNASFHRIHKVRSDGRSNFACTSWTSSCFATGSGLSTSAPPWVIFLYNFNHLISFTRRLLEHAQSQCSDNAWRLCSWWKINIRKQWKRQLHLSFRFG